MEERRSSSEPESDALPPALARALGEIYSTPDVPAGIDEAVLNRARARFASLRRFRPVLRLASLAAAAAILLFAAGLLLHRPAAPGPRVASRQDLNGDGRVDVRDALYLAQHVRAGSTRAEWDFSGDGRVDQKDADVVAQSAVSLKGAPLQ